MERDQFFKYMYKTRMLQVNPKEQSEKQRHERGLQIHEDLVEYLLLLLMISVINFLTSNGKQSSSQGC